MHRIPLVLLVATAALAAAPFALAKDGVKATLTTAVPRHAQPGARITVSWRLGYVEKGRWRPFGASEIFVRLLSASGSDAKTSFATPGPATTGEWTATVAVPEGGIGDLQVGLRGYSSGEGGSHTSDMIFPITNDPFPRAVVAPRASTESRSWPFALAGGLLWLLAVPVVALRRRR